MIIGNSFIMLFNSFSFAIFLPLVFVVYWLIFLATPLASQDPGRANEVVSNRVFSVAEKIRSMGIEYYDYRAACPDNKFRDAGHLLRSSAYEFTKKFYAEVLKQTVSSDTK